jgi:hypothetical protein
MDIARILELLETTPQQKIDTAKRVYTPTPISATESANDILNRELGLEETSVQETAFDKKAILEKARRLHKQAMAGESKDETERPLPKRVSRSRKVGTPDDLTRRPVIPQKEKDMPADEDINLDPQKGSAFPESLIFDEEAFAEEYGIDIETVTGAYVPESEDGQVPEHIEISFTFEESNVILSIRPDATVEETVDGQFIDPPQFAGRFDERENEDGSVDQVIILDLIEEEDSEDFSEDEVIKSEGDEEYFDEDGKKITGEEFINQKGLEEDEYYATGHGMNVSKNPANRIDYYRGTSRPERSGTESLAARTARKHRPYKR